MNPSGKTKAIIAYITFIGFLISVSMNKDKRDAFAAWHIKNMFGLLLLLFVAVMTQFYINIIVGDVLYWIAVASWLFSLIMTLTNRASGIPYLSEKFQKWFTFLD